ncbi:hypothetical protein TWF481_006269 [Arthrobotrys musiformis]|uniref:Uncharacterized protein n=1 Tax=Arthrobotrys musiformis TaxID=47236 RepID=A0AAV9WHT5_9PEZI
MALLDMASPHLSLNVGSGGTTSALRQIQDMDDQVYEEYQRMWADHGINSLQHSEDLLADIMDSLGFNLLDQEAQPDAILNSGANATMDDELTHQQEPILRTKYLLHVSRSPETPSEYEEPGTKRFRFNNFDEFESGFENWMSSQFVDPQFAWDKSIFYKDLRKASLCSLEAVIADIQATLAHYQVFDAALYLRLRDDSAHSRRLKGKARVSESGCNRSTASTTYTGPEGVDVSQHGLSAT